MSRSVSSVRSSDPWLRRTDRLPLAQCRGLLPGEGKVGQHFFRVLSPGLAAQMHRLFCIFAELLSFSHGAISPESAPYEMSPHFEELSGQNCSLCESSLVVGGGTNAFGRGCLAASGRLRPILRKLQQMLEPLSPAMVGFGTHRTASLENTRCCLGWPLLLPQRV